MSDNTAMCVFLCVAMLCMTTCSVSQDYASAHKQVCPAVGKRGDANG